ncbi:MAG: Nif3-like dinuclear metal center hexameric protein, partial [Collinsella sp.]|nr:Nif3-like dinuclear metal center hexameric protein [Collinsella sp.]
RCGVSIISLHTNLDRSHEARICLSKLLDAVPDSSLEHVDDPKACGLGVFATLNDPCTLRDLAARAATAFGSDPRVWGDAERPCRTVAILGGSLGDFGELAIAAGADVIVTGEAGYHVAQDLALRGLSVILLGHDRSEEPFVDILMNSAVDAGVDPRHAIKILNPCQWWTVTKGENL